MTFFLDLENESDVAIVVVLHGFITVFRRIGIETAAISAHSVHCVPMTRLVKIFLNHNPRTSLHFLQYNHILINMDLENNQNHNYWFWVKKITSSNSDKLDSVYFVT